MIFIRKASLLLYSNFWIELKTERASIRYDPLITNLTEKISWNFVYRGHFNEDNSKKQVEEGWICNRRSNLPLLGVKGEEEMEKQGRWESKEAGWKCWAIFRTPDSHQLMPKLWRGLQRRWLVHYSTIATHPRCCRFRSSFIRLNGIHSKKESRFRQ